MTINNLVKCLKDVNKSDIRFIVNKEQNHIVAEITGKANDKMKITVNKKKYEIIHVTKLTIAQFLAWMKASGHQESDGYEDVSYNDEANSYDDADYNEKPTSSKQKE